MTKLQDMVVFFIFLHVVGNNCQSSPCQHGGTCINGINVFQCSCTCNYAGVFCESGKFVYEYTN